MSDDQARIEAERQMLLKAQRKGGVFTFLTYARLSGPGWRQARGTLVSLGKDSIPILIVALDKDKPVYREHKPRYGAQTDGASVPFTLKEVAYEVLVDIVMHYSSFKGQLPELNKAKWERWWNANGSGLVVQGTKRTISESR